MKFGLFISATDETLDPARLAQLVEQVGFESLFLPEHTHIPVRQETEYPFGGEVPRDHRRTLDPLVALSIAASATSRLRVATGICLVLQHHPLGLAKALSTLDRLSEGRLIVGVGAGWNREELRNHGVDPRTRMRALREYVHALVCLWTQDEPEYHGEFVDFDPVWSWPKPVQTPHPPLLLGGNHENATDRVLDLGSGWLPNVGRMDDRTLERRMRDLEERADDRGEPTPAVSAFRAKPTHEVVERYEALGVDRCVIAIPTEEPSEVERRIEELADLVANLSST